MSYSVSRYHDISAGHRVVGHESKCKSLHGHNYRIHFTCTAEDVDHIGRVIDFGVIKQKLCMWVEKYWDHKMLLHQDDPYLYLLYEDIVKDVYIVPFNPTAENMARFLVQRIGPIQLEDTGVVLQKVVIEETRKCSAEFSL